MKDLEQDIVARFDPDQKAWDKNEEEIIEKIKKSYLKSDNDFFIDKKEEDTPHKNRLLKL